MSNDDQNSKIDPETARTVRGCLVLTAFFAICIGLGYGLGAWAGWLSFGLGVFLLAVRVTYVMKAQK